MPCTIERLILMHSVAKSVEKDRYKTVLLPRENFANKKVDKRMSRRCTDLRTKLRRTAKLCMIYRKQFAINQIMCQILNIN